MLRTREARRTAHARDALTLVVTLCRRFHLFAHQMHALLKLHFEDVRAEEATPSVAGKSGRMDFLLKDEGIVMETETRRNLKQFDSGRRRAPRQSRSGPGSCLGEVRIEGALAPAHPALVGTRGVLRQGFPALDRPSLRETHGPMVLPRTMRHEGTGRGVSRTGQARDGVRDLGTGRHRAGGGGRVTSTCGAEPRGLRRPRPGAASVAP